MFKECFVETEGEPIKDFAEGQTFSPSGFTCDECNAELPEGSRLNVATGKWEGEDLHFQTCEFCQAVKRDFCPQAPLGGLWDYIEIEYGLTPTEVLEPSIHGWFGDE